MRKKRLAAFFVIFLPLQIMNLPEASPESSCLINQISPDPFPASRSRVLHKEELKTPAATLQAAAFLNNILSECRIKPFNAYSTYEADRSA